MVESPRPVGRGLFFKAQPGISVKIVRKMSAKWFVCIVGFAAVLPSCARAAQEEAAADALELVPVECRQQVARQLELAGENRGELLAAIRGCKVEHREGMAFLIANMPQADLKTLTAEFLLTNVAYAYKARNEAPWGDSIPDEIFLNYVLPYANVNERRDDWRKDFCDRFMPIAMDCKSPAEALKRLNVEAFRQLKVRYHKTKRRRPHQGPYESMEIGFASCTGLSILLADACRAVGVPARVVGTVWADGSGNHTWVEIWDGHWHFVSSAEPGDLNRAWFAGRAAAADPSKPQHCIYAASFERRETIFPMIWSPRDRSVHADDVTRFYTARKAVTFRIVDAGGAPAKAELTVRLAGRIVAAAAVAGEATFNLAAGESYEIRARVADGKGQVKRDVRIEKGDDKPIVVEVSQ